MFHETIPKMIHWVYQKTPWGFLQNQPYWNETHQESVLQYHLQNKTPQEVYHETTQNKIPMQGVSQNHPFKCNTQGVLQSNTSKWNIPWGILQSTPYTIHLHGVHLMKSYPKMKTPLGGCLVKPLSQKETIPKQNAPVECFVKPPFKTKHPLGVSRNPKRWMYYDAAYITCRGGGLQLYHCFYRK